MRRAAYVHTLLQPLSRWNMKFQHRSLMVRVMMTSKVMRIVERVVRERFEMKPQVLHLRVL